MKKQKQTSQQKSAKELKLLLDQKTADLELKNRELEIEAAMEKVRSRMLRMQKSGELEETTTVMYQQLDALGVVPEGAMVYIVIVDTNTETSIQWFVSDGTLVRPPDGELRTPMTEDPRLIKTYEAWKRKDPLLIRDLSGDELEDFKKYLKSLPSFKEAKSEMDQWPKRLVWSEASFSNGTLGFIYPAPLPDATLDILVRFAKDFDLTYTRFLDLQKAEAQAREARIEAALERVRARSMAMQASEELGEVVFDFFEQLHPFGFSKWGCALALVDKEKQGFIVWFSTQSNRITAENYFLPNVGHPIVEKFWSGYKKQLPLFNIELRDEQKYSYTKWLFDNTDLGRMPDSDKEAVLLEPYVMFSLASMKVGILEAIDHAPIPEEQVQILPRFAKVFEQTYTRFLDLQKAKAQAREAQIEVALERVRSRSMAMHKSEELRELVFEFYKQVQPFGFAKWGFEIKIAKDDRSGFYCWISPPGARIQPDGFNIPTLDHWVLKKYWSAYEQQLPTISIDVFGDDKRDLGVLLLENSDMKYLPKEIKANIMGTDYVHFSVASMRFGLLKAVDIEPIPEQKISILQRFAKVFEQTYTRFLDLQKAEAQVREAQIETALERVRSRSMAMHKSEELREVVAVLYEQMIPLGFAKLGCELILCDEQNEQLQYWSATPEQAQPPECYLIPRTIHPFFQQLWQAWEKRTPRLIVTLKGLDKRKFDKLIFEKTAFKNFPESAKKSIQAGKVDVFSLVTMKYGLLEAVDNIPLAEHLFPVLERFAKVFEQTYTRFLDLQKAEAQAREAQIEVALERVRAKAMAMHSSDELTEVANVLRAQMGLLGQPELEASSIHLYTKKSDTFDSWYAFRPPGKKKGKVLTGTARINVDSSPLSRKWVNMYFSKPEEYTLKISGNKLKEWLKVRQEKTPDITSYPGNKPPTNQYFHFSNFLGGSLVMISFEPPSKESKELQRRAAEVFNLAYRRFLDLKKAEAQAREAQLEVALERVRSRTMAMRNSDELLEAGGLLYSELSKLGIVSLTSGYVLMDKEEKIGWNYDASPADGAIMPEPLGVPHTETKVMRSITTSWKKQEPLYLLYLTGQ